MSTWKIMKAMIAVQAIWIAIIGISIFGAAMTDTKNKQKKTKNGFQTQKMEDLYQHYKQKTKA